MAGGEMMKFTKTVDEFMESYKIVDTEQVYTNGAELVPIFRMRQWFEHLNDADWISVNDRLPEDRKNCLLWYEYYHYSFEEVLPEYGIGFYVEKYDMWYGDPSTGKDVKVLYWMPLPEPPMEDRLNA